MLKRNKLEKEKHRRSLLYVEFKYLVCIYVYVYTYVCVCVLKDTKNKLMVTRGMGWWVEEMGGVFFCFLDL